MHETSDRGSTTSGWVPAWRWLLPLSAITLLIAALGVWAYQALSAGCQAEGALAAATWLPHGALLGALLLILLGSAWALALSQGRGRLRESEERLRRQREFLECVITYAGSSIAVIQGPELRYRLVNPTFQAFTPTPIIGQRYRDLFPEAAANGAEAALQRVLATGEPWQISNYPAPVPAKPEAVWEGQVVRLPPVAGEEPAALAVVWDVTARWQAEMALSALNRDLEHRVEARTAELTAAKAQTEAALATLAEGELRHRLAIDAASAALWDLDLATGDKIVNDQWYHQLGYAPGEVEPTDACWQSHVAADDLPGINQAFAACVQGRAARFDGQYRVLTQTGALRWHHAIGLVLNKADGGGPEARRLIGLTLDITDRIEAQQRIEEALHLLRLAQEVADIGIWSWDLANNRLDWDERLCAWYAVPEETRVSGLFYDLWKDRVHPEDRGQAEAVLTASLRDKVPYGDIFRLLLPDGQIRIIQSAAILETAADGSQRMVGINRDITAQRALEEGLRAARAAAEAASAAKSEFLAHMSHEIRTPLNAVLGLLQVMEQSPLNPAQRDLIGRIRVAGRSLLLLLNDILDFSKIEAGQLQLEIRPFGLALMLDQLQALFGPTAQAKGLVFRVDAAPVPPGALVGDPLRLEQVLTNLIGNAIKFTDQGEVTLRVQPLAVEETSARLRFVVTDTGIGIAPTALEALFSPFAQADAGINRRFGGTGLGLAISKRLVEFMGGVIGVESREGGGSTFWCELPFARAAAVPAGSVRAYPQGTAAGAVVEQGPRLRGRHYLLVDDNALNLDVLERMLELEGAQATRASNGQEALTRLGAQPDGFDAVLMDVQMPVLDGLSATRALRGELGLTRLPVIAVTAGVLKEEQQRAREAGVDTVLTKPVGLDQLVATLSRWAPRSAAGPDGDAAWAAAPVGPDTITAITQVEGTGSSPSLGPEAQTLATQPAVGERPEAAGRLAGPAPEAATLPVIAGLDRAHVARLTRGDVAFFRRLLSGLVAEARGVPEQVRADLARGAAAAAAARLHRLRGAAANVGALELAAAIRGLEAALGATGEEETPAVPARLAEVEARVSALLASADPWLARTEPAPSTPLAGSPLDEDAPLDPAQLAALREALAANRPRPARQLFAELQAGLSRHCGPETVQAMATSLAALDFPAALRALDEARSDRAATPGVPPAP